MKILPARRLSVAPMMDWTDRHCRYFHRLLSRHARLYTEMVTTGALVHGDVARHLDYQRQEHPVALQLGGSDAGELAHCARLGEQCRNEGVVQVVDWEQAVERTFGQGAFGTGAGGGGGLAGQAGGEVHEQPGRRS